MKIIDKPLAEIRPYENNPRRNDGAVDAVAASIKEFGWKVPIVVDRDGVIVAGHTRYKAAKKLGMTSAPCIVADDLTPDQVRAFRVADNKTAELAEWDMDALAEELKAIDLSPLEIDMEEFGFDDDDYGPEEVAEGQTDADAVPEAPPEPVSRRGAVYALGRHRLMCGDSTSAEDVARLMAGGHGDILFTSPPYSDMREYNGGKDLSVCNLTRFVSVWSEYATCECVNLGIQRKDGEIFPYWDEYIDEAKSCGLKLLAWNVWDKGSPSTCAQQGAFVPIRHEWIFVFGRAAFDINKTVEKKSASVEQRPTYKSRRQPDGSIKHVLDSTCMERFKKMDSILSVPPARKDKATIKHPAVFPVGLPLEYIKAISHENGIVCEPFCGSGTTIIAAEQCGRVCYGMELDPIYCDVIRKRWAEFVHGEGCDWQALTPEVV